MNAQYIRALFGIAAFGAFFWIASAYGGGSEPEASAWRDLNAEVEAWLDGQAVREASAAEAEKQEAAVAAPAGEPSAVVPAPAVGAGATADAAPADAAPGDTVPADAAPANPASAPSSGDGGAAAIDLNRATPEELDALPGIGPAKAQAVVAYREANGPFAKPEDVMNVKGIGPSIFEKIKDSIVAGPAAGVGN